MANGERRGKTFASTPALRLLNEIEEFIKNNALCTINEICLAFYPITEGTLRGYVVELHSQERISHVPITRSGPGNVLDPRKWVVGNQHVRIKRSHDPERQYQVQRDAWPKGHAIADPQALPLDFFKVAARK